MTPTPLAEIAPRERPTLFERPTWSATSAAGRLCAIQDELECLRHCEQVAANLLGDFARGLGLLTARESERAVLLLTLVDTLFEVAGMSFGASGASGAGDPVPERIDNLNRIAFQVARALRGESVEAAFFRLFAAEARRRSFTRQALDELFAAARVVARKPRAEGSAELDVRAHHLGESIATALLGAEPSSAAVDLAAGLLRLARLQGIAAELEAGRCPLPTGDLPEPLKYRNEEELTQAVTRECGHLHNLLLKGARAVGEVPLTFRRPVAFALPVAIALLGLIEERPRAILRSRRRVGPWKLRATHWRARYTPLG